MKIWKLAGLVAIFTIFSFAFAPAHELTVTPKIGQSVLKNGKNWTIAAIEVEIEPKSYIYWNEVQDVGLPSQLKLDADESENVKEVEFLWPTPSRKNHSSMFQLDQEELASFIYEGKILIPMMILPKDEAKLTKVNLNFNYSICGTHCSAGEKNVIFEFAPNFQNQEFMKEFEEISKNLPRPIEESPFKIIQSKFFKTENNVVVFVLKIQSDYEKLKELDLALNVSGTSILTKPEISFDSDKNIRMTLKFDHHAHGLNLYDDQKVKISGHVFYDKYQKSASFSETLTVKGHSSKETPSDSLFYALLLAITGGLILNFMPCVLPVLSIKVLTLINHSSMRKSQIRISFFASALGIIFSFLSIAAITAFLKFSGNEFNYGFQFQEPIFIITMVLIMVLFTSNLLGEFEIQLPNKIANKLYKFENKNETNNILRSFFSGVLATLLATPCSAPFVGTSITFALSRSYQEIMLVFFCMGVGMSIPFLLFTIFPILANLLPKPGAWMNGLRKFLAILLILTVIWLIFIISNQIGKTAAFILFGMLVLFKFSLSQKKGFFKSFMIIMCISLSYVLPTNYHRIAQEEKAQNDKIWHEFEEEKISKLVEEGKIVVIDVTSEWCINCKINKFLVLDREFTRDYLKSNEVYPMRADITNPNSEVNRFMQSHGRYAIPFNVIYGPGAPSGILLPEFLTSSEFVKAFYEAKGD